jgi:23S rRNA pseudouridine1911/1915/1917 synthase
MVVAKTDRAHLTIAKAFAEREVDKRYIALVWGHLRPEDGVIDRAIGRSRTNATKMTTTMTRGARRPALTEYETRRDYPGFALVDVHPHTGRTHQIRVHMQDVGHPLVGDDRYGGSSWRGVQDPLRRKALREFDRLALHASRLSFNHPSTGDRVSFESALPAPFLSLLTALGKE